MIKPRRHLASGLFVDEFLEFAQTHYFGPYKHATILFYAKINFKFST